MALKGIDVSRWQSDIDWKKVKESGIEFVIIKAGGADDGYYTDSKFEKNYKGAKAVGLKVGAYFFCSTSMDTAQEGRTQAEYFASIIKGKQFEFPVYADIEAQTGSKTNTTNAAISFCSYMEEAGYWTGIYGSDVATFTDKLDYDKVKRFTIWCARYYEDSKCVHAHDVRQYSDKGSVPGINVNVDMNISYKDFEELIKAKGLNGWGEVKEEVIPSISMPSTIKTYKKTDDIQLTKNFHLREFICKCGQYCSTVMVDLKLFAYLQAIRDHFGKPLTPTSGYRCATHNKNVGGASQSYHTKGRACDFIIEGVKPSEIAAYAESLGCLGIGLYEGSGGNFVHIDTRTTKFFWYSSAEIPRTTFGGTPVKVETTTQNATNKVQETTTNGLPTKRVVASQFGKKHSNDYVAEYKTTSGLNCRDGAGTNHKALCVIPNGTTVKCDGYYTDVNGTAWLDVTFVLDGIQYTGFSSSAYLKKA